MRSELASSGIGCSSPDHREAPIGWSFALVDRLAAMNHRLRTHSSLVLSIGLLLGAVLGGCSSGGPRVSADPLTDLRNPNLLLQTRTEAIAQAWELVESGQLDRNETREALKSLAWSGKAPTELRLVLLETLLDDAASEDDARQLVSLMLPREPQLEVIRTLAQAAERHHWTEATASLVRSLSRVDRQTPDTARPEYVAIRSLHPERAVEEIVFEVFVEPPNQPDRFGIDWAQRARADAWDVLARLDGDGAIRTNLLAKHKDNPQEVVQDLQAGMEDLRCIPLGGEELKWLRSLRDMENADNVRWWPQAAQAIAKINSSQMSYGLRIRHAEPIRWAAANEPEWLLASRGDLLEQLRSRLDGRKKHPRREDDAAAVPIPERLDSWESILSWADILTILVVDEAVRAPGIARKLFEQAGLDHDDRTTEYGGLLETGADRDFAAILYPPRPSQRSGDRKFVASTDMIERGDRSLAHYHLHVQETFNGSFAGPSQDDLRYAARSGRTCIVFTSVNGTAMGVDIYLPTGAVLDIGEIDFSGTD